MCWGSYTDKTLGVLKLTRYQFFRINGEEHSRAPLQPARLGTDSDGDDDPDNTAPPAVTDMTGTRIRGRLAENDASEWEHF